jgi:hypothetical protein
MKFPLRLPLLVSLQLILITQLLVRTSAADTVSIMAFNQANALNSQFFQNQWGDRVSVNGEQVGPVDEEASNVFLPLE